MSRNCMSSLQGAERATTPMPSWEDFACGRKRAGAIPPLPERLVHERRKETTRNACTDPDDLPDVEPRRHAGASRLDGCRPRPGRHHGPPGTRSLSPTTPFQLILPSAHLLGDWYGLRPWLEDHGITPTVTFVTDALGNPTGGREQGFTGAHNLGLDLLFDLEKLVGLRGGSFHFLLSQRFRTSLSRADLGHGLTVPP